MCPNNRSLNLSNASRLSSTKRGVNWASREALHERLIDKKYSSELWWAGDSREHQPQNPTQRADRITRSEWCGQIDIDEADRWKILADSGEINKSSSLRVARLVQDVPTGTVGTIFQVVASGLGDLTPLLESYHEVLKSVSKTPQIKTCRRLSLVSTHSRLRMVGESNRWSNKLSRNLVWILMRNSTHSPAV